jgi:ABC-type Zn2+ transport system substrate-binding protein/surface adhesin
VVAMLVALVTAPFYHSHDHDDHGSSASLVHAHFWNDHVAESHSEDEIEAPDHHHQARSVDFFIFQTPPDAFVLAIDLSEGITVPVLERSRDVKLPSEPRAHSPPANRFLIPRSPPSI